MMRRRLALVALASIAMTLGVLTAVSAPASAATPCTLYDAPTWVGWQVTSRSAGVPETLTINWLDTVGCLSAVTVSFIGNNGQNIQTVGSTISRSGTTSISSATWTPIAGTASIIVKGTYTAKNIFNESLISENPFTYPSFDIGAFSPPAAPSSPTSIGLSGDDRTLTISWNAPASNASAVAKYVVKRAQDGSLICDVSAMQTACTVSNQPDGVYSFNVTALNALGAGESATTPAVTVGPPGSVGFSSISRKGRNIATLTWKFGTGTTATPTAYRVLDEAGRAVCAIPVTIDAQIAGSMTCNARLTTRPTRFKLIVETTIGSAESPLSPPLRAKPKAKSG